MGTQKIAVTADMGMGMKPFMAAEKVGLSVVKGGGSTVGDAIDSYLKSTGKLMNRDELCGGSGGGCNH